MSWLAPEKEKRRHAKKHDPKKCGDAMSKKEREKKRGE